MDTLNQIYSSVSTRRRYEVWFLRMGLADGSGAWWLRYLLMNPGRAGCPDNPSGMPVQVWATWFPSDGTPQSFIQGFRLNSLQLSGRGQSPFHFRIGENEIGENACCGKLEVDGHKVSWDLHYRSTFAVTLSSKGWIGFSRSPHSNATFSGRITLDGREFHSEPLGFGVQGHNCGYRHRSFWTWAHAYFPNRDGSSSSVEALAYDMPLGLVFRKAVLWHNGRQHVFRNLRETKEDDEFAWTFRGSNKGGLSLDATFCGAEQNIHRLPYLKTDCSGTFEVTNNSFASASVRVERDGMPVEELRTTNGAVLEIVGRQSQ